MSVRQPLGDEAAAEAVEVPEGLEVLSEGGLALLATRPDTVRFAQRLVELADVDCCPTSAEELQLLLPEETAASSLFLWEEPLTVTRAPGYAPESLLVLVLPCFWRHSGICSDGLSMRSIVVYHCGLGCPNDQATVMHRLAPQALLMCNLDHTN